MKFIQNITILALSTLSFSLFSVDEAHIWRYEKENGLIEIIQVDEHNLKFHINTNVDMHVCDVEGDFSRIAENEHYITLQWYDENACQVTAVVGKEGAFLVATDECNNYCGHQAGRSISGIYE